MKRRISLDLLKWKNSPSRKPLILQGARQVGKSYIVCDFGLTNFQQFIRIDFLSQKEAHLIFADKSSLVPKRILRDISFLSKTELDPKNTLLFFDEIQECAGALTSLKFFQEEMPELAIIAAGSYLGIMSNEDSFPVGKVDFQNMNPMTYQEFLEASDPKLFEEYENIQIADHSTISALIHKELLESWKRYQTIGGMPEVIKNYIEYKKSHSELKSILRAREIQNQLLTGYKADFSKHSGTVNSAHILSVFEAVSSQLAKAHNESTQKFKFTGVIPNQKGFERVRGPLTWLEKARLVIKVMINNKAEHPLKGQIEDNRFKLYFMDVGLLNAALEIPIEATLANELGSYKGYMAENFVAQELFAKNKGTLYSWMESRAELEFLWIQGKDIIPIEVKSAERSTRAKSLDSYIDRYKPNLALKLTAGNRGYDPNRKMLTMPIYLAGKI